MLDDIISVSGCALVLIFAVVALVAGHDYGKRRKLNDDVHRTENG